MIRRAFNEDKACIIALLEHNEAMNCPMIAQIKRFGFDKDFQDIWLQQNDEKQIQGVILRHFNQMYLYEVMQDADYEELASFSCFLGADRIWSAESPLMALQPFLSGFELKGSRHMILDHTQCLYEDHEVEAAGPEDCARLAAMIYGNEEFRQFYSSEEEIRIGISRRMALGQCRYRVLRQDGIIVSQAYTTMETESFATIGGVITDKAYQNRGFAGKVVSALARDIFKSGKKPNLFYHDETAGRLYKHLGFTDVGGYGMLRKKD